MAVRAVAGRFEASGTDMDGPIARTRGSRLKFTTLFSFGLKGLAMLATLGGQVILARSMAIETFGIYVSVIASTTVLSVLGGFGMPLAAVRFLPRYQAESDWPLYRGFLRRAIWQTMLSSAAMAIVFVAVYLLVPSLRSTAMAAAIGAPMILVVGLTTLGTATLQVLQLPLRGEFLSNIVRPVLISAMVGGLAFATGRLPAELVLALTGFGSLVALVLIATACWRALPVSLFGDCAETERHAWLASGAAVLVSIGAVAFIERLDIILLGAMIGPAEAGLYSVAARLAVLVSFALASVNALLGPMSAELLAKKDIGALQHILSNGVALASGIALLLSATLVLLGPFLLGVFGPQFRPAAPALTILVGGQFILTLLGSGAGMLAIAGRNRELIVIIAAAVAADLVLCVLLIPRFGIDGAAVATTAAVLIYGVCFAIAVRRLLGLHVTLVGPLRRLLHDRRLPQSFQRRVG